jgi:hypothetical protein
MLDVLSKLNFKEANALFAENWALYSHAAKVHQFNLMLDKVVAKNSKSLPLWLIKKGLALGQKLDQ